MNAVTKRGPGRPSAAYPEALRSIPLADWPASDRMCWAAACAEGGPLDPDGPAFSWAPSTRHAAEQTWGNFLNALRMWGELDPEAGPASRMNHDRLTRYIRLRRETATPNTVAQCVVRLQQILAAMCPAQDWRWIRRHPEKPGTGEIRATRERRQPPDLPLLLTGCLDLMAEADRRRPTADTAVQFRDGLIGAVLCVLPLRRKNLAGLTLGHDILVDDASIDVAIAAADTKNRRPIWGTLYGDVADGLRRYLEVHRPILLGDHASDRLWINRNGDPLDYTGFRRVMESVGMATLGRPITTHILRHAVATFTMTRDPRNGPITKDLLSHRTARTAQQYYDESGRAPAQREWERILQANRRTAMEELEWRER